MQSRKIGPDIFNIKALKTICVALLSAQVPLLAVPLPLTLHTPAAIAETQKAEAVARIAQAITVRIEGATQGSGVLVKRDGDRYTVLTAWHVVSGQREGEELVVITADGAQHSASVSQISRIRDDDAALIFFSSPSDYAIATAAARLPSQSSRISICGYSAQSPNVISERCEPRSGTFLGFESTATGKSTKLFYNARTEEGYSGGPVMTASAELLGIHTSGNRDYDIETETGFSRKTGINEGLLIASIFSPNPLALSAFHASVERQYEPYKNPKELELCADLDLSSFACSRAGRKAGQIVNSAGTFDNHSLTYTRPNTINKGLSPFERVGVTLLSPIALLFGNNPFAAMKDAWLSKNTDLHVKVRLYSERNNRVCGVMVTRFGPNYQAMYRYSQSDPRYTGSLWESEQKANDEMDLTVKSVDVLLNGRAFRFVRPSSADASSPNLLGFEHRSYGKVYFDPGVWGRGRGVQKSPRKASSDNFMISMPSQTTNGSATLPAGRQNNGLLRINLIGNEPIEIKLSRSDIKHISRLLSQCEL